MLCGILIRIADEYCEFLLILDQISLVLINKMQMFLFLGTLMKKVKGYTAFNDTQEGM